MWCRFRTRRDGLVGFSALGENTCMQYGRVFAALVYVRSENTSSEREQICAMGAIAQNFLHEPSRAVNVPGFRLPSNG